MARKKKKQEVPEPEVLGRSPELVRHGKNTKTVWTAVEVRAHEQYVESLLLLCMNERQIVSACAQKFGFGRWRSNHLMVRVREQWMKDSDERRLMKKAEAEQRLMRHIQGAIRDKRWPAVAQLEGLLADVQGTREAAVVHMSVDMQVSHSLMRVVAEMSTEQLDELAAAGMENERLAQAYRAENPQLVVSNAERH